MKFQLLYAIYSKLLFHTSHPDTAKITKIQLHEEIEALLLL